MPEGYWDELRDVARRTDPELALAQHLERERRRLHRWYPYGESWRRSRHYEEACRTFEEQVLDVLAQQIAQED